jgi:hypothetical protein
MIISPSVLPRIKYVSEKKNLRKSRHISCVNIFFLEHRAVYEIMWKNTVEPGRPQLTIRCMRIAYWMPKATNTLSICNTCRCCTAKIVARTRLNVTLHVHCLSLIRILTNKCA